MAVLLSLTDACDPTWHRSRDGLIISDFVFSTFVLILAIILLITHKLMVRIHKEIVRNCTQIQ